MVEVAGAQVNHGNAVEYGLKAFFNLPTAERAKRLSLARVPERQGLTSWIVFRLRMALGVADERRVTVEHAKGATTASPDLLKVADELIDA